jgi:hypothetical protein
VRVRRGEQQCGGSSESRRPPGPLGESPHEQVGGQRGGEGKERVHATEAAVDAEQLRGRDDKRSRDAGQPTSQAAAEVVAEDDRGESEENRDGPERKDGRLDGEGEVREEEMERRAAAVDHHGLDDIGKRLRGDQSGERLVLVNRLRRRIPYEPDEQVDEHAADGGRCCDGWC